MKELIPLVTGAAIGYCTNWLAIKMLFKPYKQKKIFGIRIPFTPGVIPKERERIAAQIGKTIGNYLLTDEVLTKELVSDKILESIESNVDSISNKYLSGEYTYSQLFEMVLGEDSEKYILKINDVITRCILDELYSDAVMDRITAITEEKIIMYLTTKASDMQSDIFEQTYFGIINDKIINSDKDLVDTFGTPLISNTKEVFKAYIPLFIDVIKEKLKDEELAVRIKGIISDLITEKVGALGAMFVNVDSMYQSAIEKVNAELETEEMHNKIELIIDNMMDEFCNKTLKDIIPQDSKEPLINNLSLKLSEITQNIITDYTNNNKEQLKMIIHNSLEDIFLQIRTNKEFDEIVKNSIRNMSASILNKPVIINATIKAFLSGFIKSKYKYFVEKKSAALLKSLDLSKLIEREINAFDLPELEDMILSIVKNELRAITWFGAVLGFIMGGIIVLT